MQNATMTECYSMKCNSMSSVDLIFFHVAIHEHVYFILLCTNTRAVHLHIAHTLDSIESLQMK